MNKLKLLSALLRPGLTFDDMLRLIRPDAQRLKNGEPCRCVCDYFRLPANWAFWYCDPYGCCDCWKMHPTIWVRLKAWWRA